MNFPDSKLWDFSSRFYRNTTVEKNMLQLQDQYQLNVNMILLCHWLALENQQILSPQQWQQLISTAMPWNETIAMLRKTRKLISASNIAWPEDFENKTREEVIKIELNTEHMQQLAIEQAWQTMSSESCASDVEIIIKQNISHYLSASASKYHIEDIDNELQELLAAARDYHSKNQTIAL